MISVTSRPFAARLVTLMIAVATIRCSSSSSSPVSPSNGPTISGVTFNTASLQTGVASGGTVMLTAPAPAGGVVVALASSNPAVAAVQTPVTVGAGETSAGITVTGVSAGTAIISASLNGTTRQSPMLTVTAGPAIVLTSLTLSASTVVGGDLVTGTVALSGAAPAGGAVVSLSGGDPVTVPASVTVAAGVAGATFRVSTRAVGGTMPATISASYGGTSTTATLTVTPIPPPTVATARFGVSGPNETDTCTLADNGNTLNCTFNGSTSTAPGTITAWDWSFGVATTVTQTTSGPILTMPAMSCALLPPPPLPPNGPQWFTMVVTLTVHDSLGNVSAKAVDGGIRLIPHGSCGF